MFTWLTKQAVESSKGFIVESVDRFVFEYKETKNCLSIELEDVYFSGGKLHVILSLSAFNQWDNGFPISAEKQKEILQNYIDAMEFQGIFVEVVGD